MDTKDLYKMHAQPESASGEFAARYDEKIIRLPAVKAAVGLSGATIYRLIKLGDFPGQVKLGRHASGWLESSVQSWIRRKAGQLAINPKS